MPLAAAACADDAAPGAADPNDAEVVTEPGDSADVMADGNYVITTAPPGEIVRLQVDHGAFPATGTLPNALVYIPHGFDKTAPLNVVVYLHGWWNCVDNVIRTTNGVCVTGGAKHNAYNLANQLETSRKNAILLVIELAFEQASSAPGTMADQDGFLNLVDDVLAKLGDKVAGHTVTDLDQIVVASHSGGYLAAAGIVSKGGLPVNELYLLDSLYGGTADFDGWVTAGDNETLFAAHPFERRLASIYTLGGGTLANSQAMATRAKGWFTDATVILDDRTTATLRPDQYARGLMFKRSALLHDDVPRYYFSRLLITSALPNKP